MDVQIVGGYYQLTKQIGRGSFGETYLAKNLQQFGKRCLVKHLQPINRSSEIFEIAKNLFEKEARILLEIGNNHDQIPSLLAYFPENKNFYLVQEFIEGHELSQEIVEGQPWSESAVIKLLEEILLPLAFLHHRPQPIIHRDLKPSNLMRRANDNKIVLIDFGAIKELAVTEILNKQGNTKTTMAIGSPGYMPAEQRHGHPQLSSDVYAVGIIAIKAITGLHPNDFDRDAEGEIVLPEQTSISIELNTILRKMVRYYHKERYYSAVEALEAIGKFQQNTQIIKQTNHINEEEKHNIESLHSTQPTNSPAELLLEREGNNQTTRVEKAFDSTKTRSAFLGKEVGSENEPSTLKEKPPQKQNKAVESSEENIRGETISLTNNSSVAHPNSHGQHPSNIPKNGIYNSIVGNASTVVPEDSSLRNPIEPKPFKVNHNEAVSNISPEKKPLPRRNLLKYAGITVAIIALTTIATEILDLFKSTQEVDTTPIISNPIETDRELITEGNSLNSLNFQIELIKDIKINSSEEVWSLAISPQGKIIASGTNNGSIDIYDRNTGQTKKSLGKHENVIRSLVFSPETNNLIVGDGDGIIKIWNLETSKLEQQLQGHLGSVWSLAISPDGQTLVSSGEDKAVRIWNLKTGEQTNISFTHSARVFSLAFTPDGQMFASSSADNKIKIWDANNGKLIKSLSGHQNAVRSIAITPNGKYLVSGSWDKTVKIWELASGKLISTFEGHENRVVTVAVSKDSQTVFSGAIDNTIKVWSIKDNQLITTLSQHEDWVLALAINQQENLLVSGSKDSTIKLWQY
ncbi:MAG: protein kinase [Xenococcaceae cyanobacterium]